MPGLAPGIFIGIAFSSEVDAGSRQENASNLRIDVAKDRDNSGS
jgi:hypothetical protein